MLVNRRFNLLTFICFIQFISVWVPIYFDIQYPFSASRNVADYLKKNNLDVNLLLGDIDICVAPVAGYLNKKIYYPLIDDYSTYVIWNHPNRKIIKENYQNDKTYHQKIKTVATKLAKAQNRSALLILNYRIDEKPLKEFPVSIVSKETYYIYRVNPFQNKTFFAIKD